MKDDTLVKESYDLIGDANRILAEIISLIRKKQFTEAARLRIFYQEQIRPRILEFTTEMRHKTK